jgi:hypothetical protein
VSTDSFVSVVRPSLKTVAFVVALIARFAVGLGNLYLVYLLFKNGHPVWALLDLTFGTGIVLGLVGPLFAAIFALIAMTPIGSKKVPAEDAWRYE